MYPIFVRLGGFFFHRFWGKRPKGGKCTQLLYLGCFFFFFFNYLFCKKHPTFVLWVLFTKKIIKKKKYNRPTDPNIQKFHLRATHQFSFFCWASPVYLQNLSVLVVLVHPQYCKTLYDIFLSSTSCQIKSWCILAMMVISLSFCQ